MSWLSCMPMFYKCQDFVEQYVDPYPQVELCRMKDLYGQCIFAWS